MNCYVYETSFGGKAFRLRSLTMSDLNYKRTVRTQPFTRSVDDHGEVFESC